jgi:hypothetical protein
MYIPTNLGPWHRSQMPEAFRQLTLELNRVNPHTWHLNQALRSNRPLRTDCLTQLYLELFVLPEKFFIVHVDISIKDREPPVRFTITNMDKEYSVAGGNTLKIPYQVERPLWTILCVDVEEHLENKGLLGKQQKSMRGCHVIRGFTICANLVIRGIYTSPNIYDWDSLPKEMSFKLVKGGRWSDQYNFVYLPSSINPEEIRRKMRKE